MKITLFKEGSLLRIRPVPPSVGRLLEPLLTYQRTVTEYEDGRRMGTRGGSRRYTVPTNCYRYLPHEEGRQLLTTYGFRDAVQEALQKAGHELFFKDMLPHPRPEVFKPDWSEIDKSQLLVGQEDVLRAMCERECGRINCYTGFGKSFALQQLGKLLRKAKIHVVTKSTTLAKVLFRDLAKELRGVGLVGAGERNPGKRITVYTADSLHHSDYAADLLFADEGHELALSKYIRHFVKYKQAHKFLLSASQDMRADGADFELIGLFGPEVATVTYQEGQSQGRAVPIRVLWREVMMDINPCEGLQDVPKRRAGVWRNDHRNACIVEDARQYDDNTQVLISVQTLDHAMQLKYDLPEFTLVYAVNGLSDEDRDRYIRWNLITADEPYMNRSRAQHLREDFEQGKLKKVIATSVWTRGVNFRYLAVLIRADASGRKIDDVQWAGRISRPALAGFAKPEAILHDYMDQFDKGFRRMAINRQKSYQELGFTQNFPEAKSRYRQQMLEGM